MELPPEEYEGALARGNLQYAGAVTEVEVRQQDGLLAETWQVIYLERLSQEVAHSTGLPTEDPVIRVWLRPRRNDGSISDVDN